MDHEFINGIIAVKEKQLLGERIARMSGMTAEEAFRVLLEAGFGGDTEAADVHAFERLVEADERDTDAFILRYAPTDAERSYFLAPCDFHNAKAIVKAGSLEAARPMLAPNGLCSAEEIARFYGNGKGSGLTRGLEEAISAGKAALEGGAGGAELGMIFERALYAQLAEACKKRRILKKLIAGRADRLNLLSAFRAKGASPKAWFLQGGTLKEADVCLAAQDARKLRMLVGGSELSAFGEALLDAKEGGKPFVAAEKLLASYEADFFAKRRFDLQRELPFLYYVFRRRAENDNVRILFVCLLAGMGEEEVKARLRAI